MWMVRGRGASRILKTLPLLSISREIYNFVSQVPLCSMCRDAIFVQWFSEHLSCQAVARIFVNEKMMAWMDDPDLGDAVWWQHGAHRDSVCYAVFSCISACYTFLKGSVSIDARRCVKACVGTFFATEYVGTM